MVTIDLGAPADTSRAREPAGLLEGLPRRVALTLPELRLIAELAGGAPLPFEAATAPTTTALEDRLGRAGGSTDGSAYRAALDALHDPVESLTRRGLLEADRLDPSLAGAVGLLATPEIAVDVDVVVEGVQARSWHRQTAEGVAALSTVDGLVFELAWLHGSQWADELARVAALPGDLPLRSSGLPLEVDVPFELLDAAGEALHGGRVDLVPVLADHHSGRVVEDGHAVPDADVEVLLQTLSREARGRLRVLSARIAGGVPRVVGVVSWVLLADGWHALETHLTDDQPMVRIRAVDPGGLSAALAPVLAEVAP